MKIKRKTLDALLWWGIRIGVVLLASLLVFVYIRTSLFRIETYDLVGVPEEIRSDLTHSLEKNSEQVFYKIFENNKILTYYGKSVKHVVLDAIPDAKSISVRSSGLHVLHIEVSRFIPLFKTIDGKGITEDGVVFSTTVTMSAMPTLSFASSSLVTETHDGITVSRITEHDQPISVEMLHNIADFSSKISSIVFPVSYIEIRDDGDVVFTDDRGLSNVYIRKDADYKKIWSALVSAIDTEPLKTRLIHEKDALLYLDVRFGNKVFYKFGNTVFQNSTSTAILSDHEKATTTSSH